MFFHYALVINKLHDLNVSIRFSIILFKVQKRFLNARDNFLNLL